jgi:hypothetical protein
MVEVLMASDQWAGVPELERLLTFIHDEYLKGWRSPQVVLPFDQYGRIWRHLNQPVVTEDRFTIHTAVGRVEILLEH